ncbi:ThiamineS/Molybdopterin converting factor subunit 1 [Phaffia rhodozyma]|uniref:ThiamineS/Molybdopterin converting factor subunit 1 n=1 Tax=Phaffia rhodozyma TaxID=264483 RepID=A0A0F7SRT7_PHARH|nr:ThiamineS/Molybdopterin converting factor subunit 1 [Phaffia rhodozyma]
MCSVHVLFFASAEDAAGCSRTDVSLPAVVDSATADPGFSLTQLSIILAIKFPKLGKVLETSTWAVDEELVPDEDVDTVLLNEGSVVAVLPPVSG